MSGLSAGIICAESGLETLIIEKSSSLGGSAALSAGMFWAPRDVTSAHNTIPFGSPSHQEAFVREHPAAVQWMRDHNIGVSPAFHGIMSIGIGYPIDIAAYIAKAKAIITQSPSTKILFETTAAGLIPSSKGKGAPVLGAVIRRKDGSFVQVLAKNTIIATGGFQGSSKLVSSHIGPGADDIFIRSNPYSTGDGYDLAQSAGTGLTRGLSTFYGHLLPSPLQARNVSPNHFIHLAQFQSSSAVLINNQGRRFCDETFGDEVNNQLLARQPGRVAYLIMSEAVKQQFAVSAPFPNAGTVDRMEKAKSVGGRVASAATIAELVPKIASWGVSAPVLAKTLAEYNAVAAAGGRGEELDAPRGTNPDGPRPHPSLDDSLGPYHVIEVQPSITFTYGGQRTEAGTGRALTNDGVVIPGLYIAGMDAGGFNNWRYCGGLALAFINGRWAAKTIVQESKPTIAKERFSRL